MDFGNPTFLWALPAAALPVLLHLFFRRRKTKVDFSTLQFFRVRQRYLAHRRRLREILLLVLRTLALLFFILALSRPLLHRSGFSLGARTDVVLVLDDSLSMGRKISTGGTGFDLAKAKAVEILETLREGDGAALVFLSGRQGMALTRRRQEVRTAIESATLTAASGLFASGVAQAAQALGASSSPNREVFLLSDFQKNQIPDSPVAFEPGRGCRVYALPLEGPAENVSAAAIVLSPRPKPVNQVVSIPVNLVNHGDSERGVDVSLTVDGGTVRKEYVVLQPGRPLRHVFEYVPTRAGVHSGHVKVEDDGLELDNRAYFCFDAVEALNVLLVQSDILDRADPFVYLRAALCPPGAETLNGMKVETTFLQELTAASLRETHVLVLCDPPAIPPATAACIEDFLGRGGAVLCFAGPRVDAGTFAGFKQLPLSGVCGPRETVKAKGIEFGGALAGLGEILQLDLVEWRSLHRLGAEPPWHVLASVAGQPVIVEAGAGAGRWLFAGFSIRRDGSNWPELKSFPVVMIHLIDAAAHDRQPTPPVECGKVLHVTPAGEAAVTVADVAGVLSPTTLPAGRPVFGDTWRPGVLRIDGAIEKYAVLAANAAESDLTTVSAGGAGERVVAARVQTLRTSSQIDSQIRKYRAGNDLSGLLLVLALLALVAETLVGNRYGLRGSRRAVEGTPGTEGVTT